MLVVILSAQLASDEFYALVKMTQQNEHSEAGNIRAH